MSIIVFQHGEMVGPGRLGRIFRDHAARLDIRRLDLPVGGPSRNRHIPPDFDGVEGVISLGGVQNVSDAGTESAPWMEEEMEFLKEAHRLQLPMVGVCLGSQMLAKALGGEVGPMDGDRCEWGMTEMFQTPVANTETILAGIPWRTVQFSAHGQEVKMLPPGATLLQSSEACKVQSWKIGLRTYCFQYHFECDRAMIDEFLGEIGEHISCAGLTPEQARQGVAAHYDEFSRLSDRLCNNLASFLFPIRAAMSA